MALVPRSRTDLGGNARGALVVNPTAPFQQLRTVDVAEQIKPIVTEIQRRTEEDRLLRDSVTSVRLEGEFELRSATDIAELDPLEPDYLDKVENILVTNRDDVLRSDRFETQRGLTGLTVRLDTAIANARLRASTSRRGAIEDDALRLRSEVEDQTLARIRQDPANAEAHVADFADQVRRLNPAISPEVVRELADDFGDKALFAEAEGLALRGQTAGARNLIDEHQEDLSPAQYRSAKNRIREIEGQQRADHQRATGRAIADFEIAIINGEVTDQAAIEEFEKGFPGIYRGREQKRVEHTRAIEAGRRARVNAQRDLIAGQAKLMVGRGLDEEKEAEAVWNERVRELGKGDAQLEPALVMNHAVNFAEESGWVPPRMAQDWQNAERTTRPTLLAVAARQHHQMSQSAPRAKGMEKAGDRIALVESLVELTGMTYDGAADQVVKGLPSNAELTARRSEFDAQMQNIDIGELAASAAGERSFFQAINPFDEEAAATPDLASTYEQTLATMFDLSGNMDVASRAANKITAQRFGRSEVGGQAIIRELPPERHLPEPASGLEPERQTRIIDDEIQQFLDEFGIEVPVVIGSEGGDTSGIPPYSLVTDRQTRVEVARGNRPTYELRVRSAQGALAPIPTWRDTQTGAFLTNEEAAALPPGRSKIENLRYILPTSEQMTESPAFQEQIKEQEERTRERNIEVREKRAEVQRDIRGRAAQARALGSPQREFVDPRVLPAPTTQTADGGE